MGLKKFYLYFCKFIKKNVTYFAKNFARNYENKNNNTWNIRRLVDESQRTSVLNFRLSNFK